jgi:hypothetical protein
MPAKSPAAAGRLAFKVRNMKFKSGVSSFKDADRSGHPSTNKAYNEVCQVKEFILDNRKATTPEVANILGLSFESA